MRAAAGPAARPRPHRRPRRCWCGGQAVLGGGIDGLRPGGGETPILLATLLWAVEMIPAKRLFASLPLTVGLPRMGLGVLLLLGWAAVNGHAGHSSPPSTPSSGTWALTLGRSPTGSAHAPPGCDPGGGNTSGPCRRGRRVATPRRLARAVYGGAVDVARTDMRCARDSHRESSITSLPADGDSSVRAVRSLVDAFLAEDPLAGVDGRRRDDPGCRRPGGPPGGGRAQRCCHLRNDLP